LPHGFDVVPGILGLENLGVDISPVMIGRWREGQFKKDPIQRVSYL
tara:strand:- start:727 stop:864 length:138 start_codon:yes stop_codon:yes gene_type:complete